jgi:hypothetical protein
MLWSLVVLIACHAAGEPLHAVLKLPMPGGLGIGFAAAEHGIGTARMLAIDAAGT